MRPWQCDPRCRPDGARANSWPCLLACHGPRACALGYQDVGPMGLRFTRSAVGPGLAPWANKMSALRACVGRGSPDPAQEADRRSPRLVDHRIRDMSLI